MTAFLPTELQHLQADYIWNHINARTQFCWELPHLGWSQRRSVWNSKFKHYSMNTHKNLQKSPQLCVRTPHTSWFVHFSVFPRQFGCILLRMNVISLNTYFRLKGWVKDQRVVHRRLKSLRSCWRSSISTVPDVPACNTNHWWAVVYFGSCTRCRTLLYEIVKCLSLETGWTFSGHNLLSTPLSLYCCLVTKWMVQTLLRGVAAEENPVELSANQCTRVVHFPLMARRYFRKWRTISFPVITLHIYKIMASHPWEWATSKHQLAY